MKNKIALGIGISFVTASLITLSPPAHAAQGSKAETKIIQRKSDVSVRGVGVNSSLKKTNRGRNLSAPKNKKITNQLSADTKNVKQGKTHVTPKKIKTTNDKKQFGIPNGEMKKNGARRAPPVITP